MFKKVKLIKKRPRWCDYGDHTLKSNAFSALCLRISDYVIYIEGIRVTNRKQFNLLLQALIDMSKSAGIKHIVCAGFFPSWVIEVFEDNGFSSSHVNSSSSVYLQMDF